MSTRNIPSCYRNSKRYPYYAFRPGAVINPHWLELPLSRTNFHGPKGVRAYEVLLYCVFSLESLLIDGTMRGLIENKNLRTKNEITDFNTARP